MPSIVQVGAGSGGMVVLDLASRDERVTRITLIEPDEYKARNVARHYFGGEAVGMPKARLAAAWLQNVRPDLDVQVLQLDLTAADAQPAIENAIQSADLGVCAVDNEPAKYHWDALMRKHAKPWTLGEVLSGGIGGFIHWFVPDGPCYGCVASFLQREVTVDKPATPDYSQPGGVVAEVTVPASKTSIHAIASLHAQLTLQLLEHGMAGENKGFDPGFTSLLFTLASVPDVFEEAYRPHRLRIARSAECLICRPPPLSSSEDLDVALDQALARLGHA